MLSKRQQIVLDATLRSLDISNQYLLGDRIRLAFGIEIDQLQTPDRAAYVKVPSVFTDHGMARGYRYFIPGEVSEFRKIWNRKRKKIWIRSHALKEQKLSQ